MIELDMCHRELIYGLIRAYKPKNILELGYGTGLTTRTILSAIAQNQLGKLTVIDNFLDFEYNNPGIIEHGFKLVESSEELYVKTNKSKYDFIVADADHYGTNKWLNELLGLATGIVVFHDITNPSFPNLYSIVEQLPSAALFNQSTTKEEQCYRGLLVYFVPIPK